MGPALSRITKVNHPHPLHVPLVKSKFHMNLLFPRTLALWNTLPVRYFLNHNNLDLLESKVNCVLSFIPQWTSFVVFSYADTSPHSKLLPQAVLGLCFELTLVYTKKVNLPMFDFSERDFLMLLAWGDSSARYHCKVLVYGIIVKFLTMGWSRPWNLLDEIIRLILTHILATNVTKTISKDWFLSINQNDFMTSP